MITAHAKGAWSDSVLKPGENYTIQAWLAPHKYSTLSAVYWQYCKTFSCIPFSLLFLLCVQSPVYVHLSELTAQPWIDLPVCGTRLPNCSGKVKNKTHFCPSVFMCPAGEIKVRFKPDVAIPGGLEGQRPHRDKCFWTVWLDQTGWATQLVFIY